MFNVVEKNQKLVKTILVVVAGSFAVFGVGAYLGMGGDDGQVAKVGSAKIYNQDIDNVIRQQQDTKNLDKMQILLGLINRQLLINNFKDNRVMVTDQDLKKAISEIPALQESGVFSVDEYKRFLRATGMSVSEFQQSVGDQLLINQFVNFFQNSTINSKLYESQLAVLLSKERTVASYTIDPKSFYGKINITEKQISEYYKQNVSQYTTPEMVKLQYIELSKDSLISQIKPSIQEIKDYIKINPSSISLIQVDASHILFAVPSNADVKAKEMVRQKAIKILDQLKSNPKMFSKLAKEYSDDPSSAEKGGELGLFGKGVMVPQFESVAFSMKPGQISGLVETKFGYHIIKLNSIKIPTDQEISGFVADKIKQQQVVKLIASKQSQLSEIAYNKPDSLIPASKAIGVEIKTTDWVTKGVSVGEFANPKVQKAVFSDDLIKKKNNSEVIDLGNNKYAVYRLSEYKPQIVQSESAVKDKIINVLKQQQAVSMAYMEGQKDLSDLKAGKLSLKFDAPEQVSLLSQSKNVDNMAIKQIFTTNLTKNPAYTGVISGASSYVIYKITGETINQTLIKQNQPIVSQILQQNSMTWLDAYINGLRNDYKVTYNSARIIQDKNENLGE